MLEKLLLILNDICGELHALNTKLEGAVFEGVTQVPAPTVTQNAMVGAPTGFAEAFATPVTETGVAQKSPAPSREELGKALIALATEKGREAAVAALGSFGAAALKDVIAEQYPNLLAAIAKARQ